MEHRHYYEVTIGDVTLRYEGGVVTRVVDTGAEEEYVCADEEVEDFISALQQVPLMRAEIAAFNAAQEKDRNA